MSHSQVHYEVFSRKTLVSSWSLQMATEDRALAIQSAEDLLADRHAAAVKVCKEVLDRESGEYSTVVVLNKGLAEPKKKVKAAPETDTVCTSPQDLYTLPAREKISRLLEDWLKRNNVT
ncbi:MAG: hypothetical protein JF615_05250, partial [Asticcacaulis sp.]|nr:hypothetical protein [Asticcacaulis sp.]